MNLRVLLVTPLVLPFPATDRQSPDEVTFAPREGLILVKKFSVEREHESENASEFGSTTMTSTSERFLVVTDHVQKVADGRVTELERIYDRIGSQSDSEFETNGEARDSSTTGSSEVEGATVTFEWDEDEQDHVAGSDEVDADVLEELVYDLDFVSLLPAGEVSESDEWDVDVEAFEALLNPWDGLSWEWDRSDGETSRSGESEDEEREEPEVEESKDGDVVATYEGTREVDGVTLAAITLEGEIELERSVEGSFESDHGSGSYSHETTDSRTIEGELLWNVTGGHLHSLRLAIEEETEGTSENTFISGDQEFESETEIEATGTATFTVSFEEREGE